MKAVVLKKFRDKKTKEIREVGEVFTCSKKRFDEIKEVDPALIEEHVELEDVSAE